MCVTLMSLSLTSYWKWDCISSWLGRFCVSCCETLDALLFQAFSDTTPMGWRRSTYYCHYCCWQQKSMFPPQSLLTLCKQKPYFQLVWPCGRSISLGVAFEVSKAHARPSVLVFILSLSLSLPSHLLVDQIWALSHCSTVPDCCHASCHDVHRLTLWNCK